MTGLLLLFGAFSAIDLVGWSTLMATGNRIMLGAALIGIPAEIVYFVALGVCLRASGQQPRGWYWRSFEHHHLLSRRQKLLVMPAFAVGTLAFLAISLGILIVVLGFIGALKA